jgi:hypothetical protein
VIELPAFLSTPRSWVIAIVALIALSIVFKVASLIVRILALLVSLATIAYFIMRARGG